MTEALKQELLRKGGTLGDWAGALTRGFSTVDQQWHDAKEIGIESQESARRIMSKGSLVEYECYDQRGRGQGRAVIRLIEWADYGSAMLKADHVVASDSYYDWYARKDLKASKAVYHVCGDQRRKCKEKLPRGDRREVVHVERWRMLTPLAMLDTSYLADLGKRALEEWVQNFVPTVPEPAVPPVSGPPVGGGAGGRTGLDEALEQVDGGTAPEVDEREKRNKEAEDPGRAKPKGSVGALLEKRAMEQRAAILTEAEVEVEEGDPRRGALRTGATQAGRGRRFFESPLPGGGRAMAAVGKTPRKAPSERDDGAPTVPRREERERAGSRRGPVDAQQDDGLRKPGHTVAASSGDHGDPKLQRTGHDRHRNRFTTQRPTPRTGGLVDATNESAGELLERPGMVPSAPSGADTSSGGITELRDGTAKSRKAGADEREAQGDDVKRQRRRSPQIGVGRQEPAREVDSCDAIKREGKRERSRGRPEASELRKGSSSDPKRPRGGVILKERSDTIELRPAARMGSGSGTVETKQAHLERERRRKEQREEEHKEPDASKEDEVTTAESGEVDEAAKDALDLLRRWLKNEDASSLSAAQSGALLALLAYRSGTGLGQYLKRSVSGSGGERNSRQRSLLPLPLKEDSVEALRGLFESGEFRKLAGAGSSKSRPNKEKAARTSRRLGLLIWHGLVVVLINNFWTGGGATGKIHSGSVSKAQEKALERLWQSVRRFMDDGSESTEKVPRSVPVAEWGTKLGDVRISYHGEVVEKGQRLTLAQILPGLPPPGYGGSVPLLELCDDELKRKLENAASNILSEEELPDEIPEPRVHADETQWKAIAKELYERGLVEPVEDPLVIRGRIVTNGAFGVVKPGRYLEDERPVLRLIMDFRGVNSVTQVLEGDVRTLTGAPALQHVVLPGSKVIRVSADDLVSAFYLFSLPPGWSRMMTFGPKVEWKALGVDRPGSVHIGARVLPMGWSSAVGVLQHAHRRLALRSPLAGGAGLLGQCEIKRDSIFPDLEVEDSLWSLYLDDMNLVEIMDKKVAEDLKDKPPQEQQRLRQAYAHWGIPVSLPKAAVRAEKTEKLGAVIDGEAGVLKGSTKRALDSISLSCWILRQEKVLRKALQVFLGKETHTIQFRRPLFAMFDYLWKDIGEGEPMVELGVKSVEEILMAGFSQPLRFTNLRAGLNEVVTASDASEHGGGLVHGSKLTSQGVRDSLAAVEGLDDIPMDEMRYEDQQKVLAIDCFAGIGGLSRSLELLGIQPARLVVIDKDPHCRHLLRVRWPGCDVWTDVKKVSKKDLEKVMRATPGLTGVICGGGSPCQGLSKLSSQRTHLEDERSKLFFDMVNIVNWVEQLCLELDLWCVNFVENVEADHKDVAEMTQALKVEPVKACSSGVSRVRRPRFFWSNVKLRDHPGFSRVRHPSYDEIEFQAKLEPLERVADPGWKWKAAEKQEELRLPTFTRAIPRKRPPPSPAGIRQCNEETLKRWELDQMKIPPYTYQEDFLFHNTKLPGQKRVASSEERERLMGFKTGYTLALFKKEATSTEEENSREVERQAALGNSFHTVVLAGLLDLCLWSAGVVVDPQGIDAIVSRAHEDLSKPRLGSAAERADDAPSEGAASMAEISEAISELEPSRIEWLRSSQDPALGWRDPKILSLRLVHHFLRRTEFRGSDVRLDLQQVYRPDAVARTSIDPHRWVWEVAQSYPWRGGEHINVLELRAILKGLEWRARSSAFHSCRFLHLSDSQICLSVLCKGRSSSRRINRLLRRVHSLCLALDAYPLWAWISSRLNPADEPSRRQDLEEVLSDYLQHLWEEGDTRTMGSYAVAALQFHKPSMKGHLKKAWNLLSLWGRLEQPQRATPLDPPMLFAFCGTLIEWQWTSLALLSVVGFSAFLRTGEMFHIRRKHVVLPRQAGQSAVIFLEDTKTSQRNQRMWEKVVLEEQVAINALTRLTENKQPNDLLVKESVQKFRELWKSVVSHLGLTEFHYLPYSLRRGGATSAYRNGATFDQLVEKGRWKHVQTARLYLDQGLQEATTLTVPSASLRKIRAAQRTFKAAGLGRVERR
eukprot:Skav211849  [mRNA]  locus=scaffold305:925833:932175:+ [translate_table: standard]